MYFEKPGPANTEETIKIAINTAVEHGIKYIVFASTTGETARKFPDVPGVQLVCVSHAYGTKAPGENYMTEEQFDELRSRGIKVCTASHVFSGVERSISTKFGGINPVELMAATLKFFSQGTKVCVECATIAADAGYIPIGEQVVTVGGSGRGADTVIILRASHASRIFDTKIDELICKPIVP